MSKTILPLRFCGVLCIAPLHDQLTSLGRHARLTRCFSAVAELRVYYFYCVADEMKIYIFIYQFKDHFLFFLNQSSVVPT